jgi:tetratricopeptide (TPR) repeat protein
MRQALARTAAAGFAGVLAACVISAPIPAHAAGEVPVGPRAIAMGNTFTAIADDATALFWNPAGLPRIGNQEITATHSDLFGSGVKSDYAAFALPMSPAVALGADWYRTGFDDGELNFGDNRIDLGCGVRLRTGLSLGVTGKYLARNTQLDEISVRQGSGAGFDLGVLYAPIERLRVGASLEDVSDTRLNYTAGNGTSVVYRRGWRVGAACQPFRNALLAADVDDRFHVGAEYAPISQVALRAGLERDLEDTGERVPTYGVGVGLRAAIFRFDYALSLHPTLGATSQYGLAMDFNFNPSQVRIERIETRDVFASLEKTYAREPLAMARVRNLQDRPLATQLKVFAPDLMDQPTEQEVVLRPKASQDVPLTALLSDKVITRTGDRRVPLTVSVSYQSSRLPRSERRTAQLIEYGPGAIRWGGGVAQAAAYVTSDDPVVTSFAREACWPIARAENNAFENRNIGFAAAIFDALGSRGVAYVPDPNSPFQSVSQAAGAIDNVQYPRQTLARRSGDCDDSSVLVAALLENVGVPTRLVDVPGHLFVLAGTGIHERNRLALGIDEGLYVVEADQVWIPLETTAISKGFAQAWKEGSDAYVSWASRGRVSTVAVEEAQARYEPAELAEPEASVAVAYDTTDQARRLSRDAAVVAAWRSAYMNARYAEARAGLEATPEALNEIAHVYYSAGQMAEAREALQRALVTEPTAARTHNNLADTYAAGADTKRALEEYGVALAADSTDAGIWLNIGLLRYAGGDTLGADGPLTLALGLSGGYEAACRLLGIPVEGTPTREGARRMSIEEARELLKAALRGVPARSDTLRGAPMPGATTPPRAWRTRAAGARSGSAADMTFTEFLYWKD